MRFFGRKKSGPPTKEEVMDVLRNARLPGVNADMVALGLIGDVRVEGRDVSVTVSVSNPDPKVRRRLGETVRETVEGMENVASVGIITMAPPPPGSAGSPAAGHRPIGHTGPDHRPPGAKSGPNGGETPAPAPRPANPFDDQKRVPGVDKVIAVASGKGGVGKSSVALNLAAALASQGHRVGLMDADMYGPSLSVMAAHREKPVASKSGGIAPTEKFGLKMISMGFLLDQGQAVVWRGPMLAGAVRQFLRDVAWGELDYLLVDLPPGTGDVHLSLVQTASVHGAIVVTTPQDVALADVRRSIRFFEKINVPLLGIVENMSGFTCPGCNETHEIFGSGGGESESRAFGVPLLGKIPLDPAVREQSDAGEPVVVARPESPVSRGFLEFAQAVAAAEPVKIGECVPGAT